MKNFQMQTKIWDHFYYAVLLSAIKILSDFKTGFSEYEHLFWLF